jgi:hypothetical protein
MRWSLSRSAAWRRASKESARPKGRKDRALVRRPLEWAAMADVHRLRFAPSAVWRQARWRLGRLRLKPSPAGEVSPGVRPIVLSATTNGLAVTTLRPFPAHLQVGSGLFRFQVGWLWHRALSRRSQNGRMLWDRMRRLIDRWLPPPRIYHPYPCAALALSPEARAGCGNPARPDPWRGLWATMIPTPTLSCPLLRRAHWFLRTRTFPSLPSPSQN